MKKFRRILFLLCAGLILLSGAVTFALKNTRDRRLDEALAQEGSYLVLLPRWMEVLERMVGGEQDLIRDSEWYISGTDIAAKGDELYRALLSDAAAQGVTPEEYVVQKTGLEQPPELWCLLQAKSELLNQLVETARAGDRSAVLPAAGIPFAEGTMRAKLARWERDGYPDGVAYAIRADGETGEMWRIGYTGDRTEVEKGVRGGLNADVELEFVPAELSKAERDRIYGELRDDWGRRFAVAGTADLYKSNPSADHGGTAGVVYVSPLLKPLYEKAAQRKWNGAVTVMSSWDAGARLDVLRYDSLGGRFNEGQPDQSFDLWLLFSVVLIVLTLVIWGVAALIASVRRKRRK